MPKFKNEYGVSKIKYTQKCRCFCPIGKADYTNNFTVTITPKKWIPDYCEIDKFIREQLDGKSTSIFHLAPLPYTVTVTWPCTPSVTSDSTSTQ